MLSKIAISSINSYQKNISPHKGYSCAYKYYTEESSCSEFTKQCIIKLGIVKSIPLFQERIEKCRIIYFSKQETESKKEVDKCNELAGICACLQKIKGNKMKLFLSVLIGFFIVMGILLSLIAIYASPDEQVHFLEASYFWVADAIAIFGLIILWKKTENK